MAIESKSIVRIKGKKELYRVDQIRNGDALIIRDDNIGWMYVDNLEEVSQEELEQMRKEFEENNG